MASQSQVTRGAFISLPPMHMAAASVTRAQRRTAVNHARSLLKLRIILIGISTVHAHASLTRLLKGTLRTRAARRVAAGGPGRRAEGPHREARRRAADRPRGRHFRGPDDLVGRSQAGGGDIYCALYKFQDPEVLQHLEPPAGGYGTMPDGSPHPEALIAREWQRASAFVALFDPLAGRFADPRLAKPDTIFASGIGQHSRSLRPQQTVQALADALPLSLDVTFPKDAEQQMVTAALQAGSAALVCLEHEAIPYIAAIVRGSAAWDPPALDRRPLRRDLGPRTSKRRHLGPRAGFREPAARRCRRSHGDVPLRPSPPRPEHGSSAPPRMQRISGFGYSITSLALPGLMTGRPHRSSRRCILSDCRVTGPGSAISPGRRGTRQPARDRPL